MKVVALVSGGKDSCYNMVQCVTEGHNIVALANLYPVEKDELDSYMFQTVGHHAIDLYAEAMNLPLFRRPITGSSIEQGRDYNTTADDEVEDLFELLKEVKSKLDIEAVSVGAILSDYQRVRVEHVCSRLGLVSLAYLWRRDQTELLKEMIDSEIHAILIKVAALGLSPDKHLGKSLAEIQNHMALMKTKYGLNECGEGGEYETFTLDCPLFQKRIVIDDMEIITHSDDAFAPVAYINFKKMHLEEKTSEEKKKIKSFVKKSDQLMGEIFSPDELETCRVSSETSVAASVNITDTVRDAQKCLPSAINVYENDQGFVWISNVKPGPGCASLAESTKSAMESLKVTLTENGLDYTDLIAVHLYVSSMSKFAEINNVYRGYFNINPPIRICVEASIDEALGLIIDCIGHKKSGTRNTMHVQGLSHWAPANIGPYSQVNFIDGRLYVAGQIAMCPANLAIIEGGIVPECRLSLRHVERVIKAAQPSCGISNITSSICYVTREEFINPAQKEWDRLLLQHKVTDGIICNFVVVPALPKNAQVEWQVQGLSGNLNRENYHDGLSIDGVELSTHSQFIEGTDTGYRQLRSCIRIYATQEKDGLPDFQLIWDRVHGIISLQLKRCDLNFKDLDCPRIFYSTEKTPLSSIYEGYKSSKMNESKSVGSCVTFVPVIKSGSGSTLFSVCI